jgi:hypothetical protein
MYCAACGYHTMEIGGNHTCRAQSLVSLPRRPDGWQIAAWVVIAITVAFVAVCVVRIAVLVQDYRLVGQHSVPPTTDLLDRMASMVDREQTVYLLYQLIWLAYLIGSVSWFVTIRKVAARYGDAGKAALQHWTSVAWRLVLAAAVALAFASGGGTTTVSGTRDLAAIQDAGRSIDREQILFVSARIVVAGLLIAAIWTVASRVAAVAGRPSVAVQLSNAARLWQARRQS